jgi:hypothetical protein
MSVLCRNCETIFEGKYCPECGQKADVGRLDKAYLSRQLKKFFFLRFFESGILYTCKLLVLSPGKGIRDYLEGRRVKYYDPFTLFIMLAALYGVLYRMGDANAFALLPDADSVLGKIHFKDINQWVAGHFAIVVGLTLPLMALVDMFLFRKQGYNFAEFFTVNIFLGIQRLMLRILLLPGLLMVQGTANMPWYMDMTLGLDLILFAWAHVQLFSHIHWFKALWRAVFSFVIYLLLFSLFIGLAVWAIGLR